MRLQIGYGARMRVTVLLALAAAGTLAAGTALACSCTYPKSAAAQLRGSEVAFVGRAVSTLPEQGARGSEGYLVTEFAVTRTLKGPHRGIRRVAHYPGPVGSICGIDFPRGRDALVLTSSIEGRLSTSSCLRPRFPIVAFERAARP